MYYITENDVHENLGMKETIDILEDAFTDYSAGNSFVKPRERIIFDGTVFNTMPGVFGKHHLAGLKTYIANKNGARYVVMVFDAQKAELLAVIEADRLGQVRTGALPAMVTRRLVPGKKQSLCIIGSGFQAETQLEGILSAFDVDEISVYSRTFHNARKFSETMSAKFGVNIKAHDNVKSALKNATIINSITDANSAVFTRSELGDEYHVNLCGGNLPTRREAAEEVLTESDLIVVEDFDQAMKESGEIISFTKNHPEKKCLELKDIMRDGSYSGRRRTVFKSMGVGLEDVAAAYVVMKNMKLL